MRGGHAIISILLFLALVGGVVFYVGRARIDAAGPLAEEATVLIPKGAGTGEVADALERAGVIDSPSLFVAAARLTRAAGNLKAGEYQFRPAVSMRAVMDTLVEGRAVQHALTIPEGWTGQMVADRIDADPVLVGPPVAAPPEGSVLPDTYRFERGSTREQMLARMQAEQRKLVDTLWGRRTQTPQLKSPADMVTLASVVEKETGKADERPRIAAVFLNRLKLGMRLQSDPTVIYGMVGGRGKLDRSLTRADLEAQTPYNTYTRAGLPDGPIANPGRAALEAVANPSQTDELYFVADGTGGHAFATSLEQHNRNVARWRSLQPGAAPAVPSADPAAPSDPNVPAQPAPAGSGPKAADPATPTPDQQGALDPGSPTGALPPAHLPVQEGQPHPFIDPVANTALDPLLDKTYDLNSPQTVPKIGALGETAATPPPARIKPDPDLRLHGADEPADKPASHRPRKTANAAGKSKAKPAQPPMTDGTPDLKPPQSGAD